MVMIFAVDKARRQLLEKGRVFTFRDHIHKVGFDWATDKRGGKKICNISITLAANPIPTVEQLAPYTQYNGFETTEEWVDIIKGLHGNTRSAGYLYRVDIIGHQSQ